MKHSINEFIVEIPKSHNDEITLENGTVVYVDVRFRQGEHVNRMGKVVKVPMRFNTKVKVGDIVIIDKNLVTFQTHSDDLVNKSKFLVDSEKGHYRVTPDMVYLYKSSPEEEWQCPAPYLFVEPIPLNTEQTESGLQFQKQGYKGNVEQVGKIVYLNGSLQPELQIGDIIYFKKDREYEFEIDGNTLYHMDNSDVVAKIENYEYGSEL